MQVSGTVFVDVNDNGVLDEEEQGLPEVLVTDGVTTTLTNDAGTYSLKTEPEKRHVYITNPPGYWCRSWFKTMPQKDATLDFALTPTNVPDEFLFIHVADPHIDSHVGILSQFCEEVNNLRQRIAFVIDAGDSTDKSEGTQDAAAVRRFFEIYRDETAALRVPLFNTIGNHDMPFKIDSRLSEWWKGAYRIYLGPTYYSFNYGDFHFIALDVWQPDPQGKRWLEAPGHVCGLEWLQIDLSLIPPDKPVVLYAHIAPGDWCDNFREFQKTIAGHNIVLELAGHGHQNKEWERNGHPVWMTTSLCGRIPGEVRREEHVPSYRIVRCRDGKVDWAIAQLGRLHFVDLQTPAAGQTVSGVIDVAAIVIDIQGEVESVTCQLDEGKSAALQPSGDGWWRTWTGTLDTTMVADGPHTLTVKVLSIDAEWPYETMVTTANGNKTEK